MAIEACKIGSDRSETLLNLNEFSPAKQTQLAKLFRLSTPKNMIVPKDICRFWVSHIIDVQLLPSTLKERRRSSRLAIFQIAKRNLCTCQRHTSTFSHIRICGKISKIFVSNPKSVNVTAHLNQDGDLHNNLRKKVEIRMIASADQNMPEHALICKVVIFSTNSCAAHAKKMAEPWTNQF